MVWCHHHEQLFFKDRVPSLYRKEERTCAASWMMEHLGCGGQGQMSQPGRRGLWKKCRSKKKAGFSCQQAINSSRQFRPFAEGGAIV